LELDPGERSKKRTHTALKSAHYWNGEDGGKKKNAEFFVYQPPKGKDAKSYSGCGEHKTEEKNTKYLRKNCPTGGEKKKNKTKRGGALPNPTGGIEGHCGQEEYRRHPNPKELLEALGSERPVSINGNVIMVEGRKENRAATSCPRESKKKEREKRKGGTKWRQIENGGNEGPRPLKFVLKAGEKRGQRKGVRN